MKGKFFERVSWVVMVAWLISRTRGDEELAPAMFVFGDSLADVGNNNYLELSIVKADFPHNGVDFPNHKPTGRFSNGKNAADFLAEKLGLPSAPPYLYLVKRKTSNFLTGVNFASGGAGLLNGTRQLVRQSIDFSQQIDYYSTVHEEMAKQLGESGVQKLQAKAIYGIVMGSNDILGYYSSNSRTSKQTNPLQHIGLMLDAIKAHLKKVNVSHSFGSLVNISRAGVSSATTFLSLETGRMYVIGARKFVVIGVGPVGCCPSQRSRSSTGECYAAENDVASGYNRGLISVLEGMKAKLQGFHYSYFNTYDALLEFTQNPAVYGFKEVKDACCGLGDLRGEVACLPISTLCANRSDHIFWDFYHPTEAADRILIDIAFDGPPKYAQPVNIRQLVNV